jgi:hypothetical protein
LSIIGATNASEAILESRVRFLDMNADGHISRDRAAESFPTLKSTYDSLDENDDGRLFEPEFVLDARPADAARLFPGRDCRPGRAPALSPEDNPRKARPPISGIRPF